jgi:hypothetical protein
VGSTGWFRGFTFEFCNANSCKTPWTDAITLYLLNILKIGKSNLILQQPITSFRDFTPKIDTGNSDMLSLSSMWILARCTDLPGSIMVAKP